MTTENERSERYPAKERYPAVHRLLEDYNDLKRRYRREDYDHRYDGVDPDEEALPA